MKEFTIGDHASVFQARGFNFVGLRDWQPGDRMSSIDWAQSSMNNFSPMVVRDSSSTAPRRSSPWPIASLSTRCGVNGVPIAAGIARAVAAVGLSAVFFQDMFGLITFDEGFASMAAVRPRIGRGHVIHCLDAYQGRVGMEDVKVGHRLSTTIGGHLRRTALVPVISDFLFEDAPERIKELAELNSVHDVFLIMVDSAFAFELPDVSAGWIKAFDIETGESRLCRGARCADSPRACARGRTASSVKRTGAASTCCASVSIRTRACPPSSNLSW